VTLAFCRWILCLSKYRRIECTQLQFFMWIHKWLKESRYDRITRNWLISKFIYKWFYSFEERESSCGFRKKKVKFLRRRSLIGRTLSFIPGLKKLTHVGQCWLTFSILTDIRSNCNTFMSICNIIWRGVDVMKQNKKVSGKLVFILTWVIFLFKKAQPHILDGLTEKVGIGYPENGWTYQVLLWFIRVSRRASSFRL
jgi:hypothetical protein